MSSPSIRTVLLVWFLFFAAPLANAQATIEEALALDIEQMLGGEPFLVGDTQIGSVWVISELFTLREFRPIWTIDSRNLDDLMALIAEAPAVGLDADDYHAEALKSLRATLDSAAVPDPRIAADLELLATDALIRLAYHRYFGKVDPVSLDADWNIDKPLPGENPVAQIEAALSEHRLADRIRALDPPAFFYENIKTALARYRAFADWGGWKPVPEGPTLRAGDRDPRVVALRRRLSVTEDLPTSASLDSAEFDAVVDAAVKRFQSRHHLTPDGVVGRTTLTELNVPVERRIDQLRVTLERARWVGGESPKKAVVVNIAAFRVQVFDNRKVVWTTRAQVGKEFRKTPIFRGKMTYVQFNPTWTVPPTILRKDILPKAIPDPDYLTKRGFEILDNAGNRVDPGSLDWSRFTPENFPYVLRQGPGPTNAMGLVKFMFPNPHFVFLHDTTSRSKFDAEVRTFSSGCIRVEHPLDLAEVILADPEQWSRAKIDDLIETGRTRNVFLDDPLPVYLVYWTAGMDAEGRVVFWRDIYGRDGAILDELNEEFRPSSRILSTIRRDG
jgi:murein L,D-transpeptidase YcbB/YkuD